jgi:hypothetical protein
MPSRLFPAQTLIAALLLIATPSSQSSPSRNPLQQGSVQEESLQPNGLGWQKLSPIRQLGYVEGFREGRSLFSLAEGMRDNFSNSCEKHVSDENAGPLRKECILHKWWGKTLIGVDTSSVLEVMANLYVQSQNLPIRWGSAVVISGAMVSGVAIDEKELQIVRQEDAKTTAALSRH